MSNIPRYSRLQQKLHWAVVALIAVQYCSQSLMRSAMAAQKDNIPISGLEFLITTLHTWGGAAIGAIMVYRLWLRWHKPVPVGAGGLRGVSQLLASSLHWGFYLVLFFMAITGMLHYYFELHKAARWHEIGEWTLLGMIFLHGLAALLHHFWKKDDVLRQMWGSEPPH